MVGESAAVNRPALQLLEANDLVSAAWGTPACARRMTASSVSRYRRLFASFLTYAEARGARGVHDLTRRLCAQFIGAPLAGRGQPSPATSRLRQTVLRAAFAELARAGMVSEDPTVSLTVESPVVAVRPVPLTPAEVMRLRTAARMRPVDTLRPATVELALAGLSHGEIARSVVGDVDSISRLLRVHQHLSAIREVPLGDAALKVLLVRIAAQRRAARRRAEAWDPVVVALALTRPLASYPLESIAPSISTNLIRALIAAGMNRPGVRPRSLREYTANRVYARTGRVEDVSSHLGIASLDSARRLIDHDWQQRFADEVRGGPD